jgi:hypothetical protein
MNKTVNWHWARKAETALKILTGLAPDEFYDEASDIYHPVHDDLIELAANVRGGSDAWTAFMKANPLPRQNWLPAISSKIDDMELLEVWWRFAETIADERMFEASTAEAFETGSLVRALERIAAEGDQLDPSNFHQGG